MDRILVTGGTGRLAHELKKILDADYVGIENFDFTYEVPKGDYDLVVHMGAYTNTAKAETERRRCFLANTLGTYNVVEAYRDTPLIYISTEYAFNPLGVYAWSKKFGEEVVKSHPRNLILRTAFKPNPWPFPFAYEDQYTQGDYVDVIAQCLADRIDLWDRSTSRTELLGTGRKTMLELAQRTRPDVIPNTVADYVAKTGAPIPNDYE